MGLNMDQMVEGESNQDVESVVIEDEGQQIETVEDEQKSVEDQEASQSQESEESADEVVVTIGEEAPPPESRTPAPEWVRELRKSNREKERRIRELEAKLNTTTESNPVVLGKKPTLEDFDYDAERYEGAIAEWFDKKRQIDEVNAKREADEVNQQRAWQSKLENYSKARAELKVKDYEDAEEVAQQLFNVVQQGVVLQGAENPALVIYALGKNPKKAKELADISDPVKFAFAVAKLEKDLKVTNRKAPPPPERVVSGTGRVSGSVDSTLERLREEAARTGNMTKVIQYKQQKRAASK
jgi:DNA repair exonuclease SbcCD ATPase subunit